MGYMGLAHYGDSDTASDGAWTMAEAVAKALEQELKETDGGGFNTNGPENVAMIFEAFICPTGVRDEWAGMDSIVELAGKVIKKLEKTLARAKKADGGDDGIGKQNKKEHLDAYQRMLKNMNEFVKFAERE